MEENQALRQELKKTKDVRDRLEELCRELQKQNKVVLDRAQESVNDEQARRQEISAKFSATLDDVSVKLEEQAEARKQQAIENDDLRDKLKDLLEKFEIREKHFETQLQTKDLENQISNAKLEQQTALTAQETHKITVYEEHIVKMQATETSLREQLAIYSEKFDSFQTAITSSNDMFTTFKEKMELMTKQITKLEREKSVLVSKNKEADLKVLKYHDSQQKRDTEIATLRKQKVKLEGLCRSLTLERQKSKDLETRKGANGTSSSTPGAPEVVYSIGSDASHPSAPPDASAPVQHELASGNQDASVAAAAEGTGEAAASQVLGDMDHID